MSELVTVSALAAQGDAFAPAAAPAGPRAVLERQLAVLGRLAEAGLSIALAVERRALAGEAPQADAPQTDAPQRDAGRADAAEPETPAAGPGGDVALAYARVARAVRLTIALQGKVVKELQALDEEAARRRLGEQAAAGRERQQAQAERKARVERIVERLIREEARDEAEGDRLADEAYERLEHDDIYGDLTARPVSEIIAMVCADLGLDPDWARLAEEGWAREELASGAAGAPLMAIRWLDPPDFDSQGAGPPRAELRAGSP